MTARPSRRRPLLIGLTGPIGCGKSTVGTMLSEVGGTVTDADQLARRATEPGRPALGAIRRRFGDTVFSANGELDRTALARIVFADATALAELEAIVHPEVRRLIDSELELAASLGAPFVALEAIKLVESGLAERCDEVWLIECTPQVQRERVAMRQRAPGGDAERRIDAQGEGLVERLAEALVAPDSSAARRPKVRRISTDGPLEATRERVDDALADALERFAEA